MLNLKERLHWDRHFHDQPHSLPHDCPTAGAQWTPDVEPYDRNRPPFPVTYSEEEKQAQVEAGDRMHKELEEAIKVGRKEFTFPPGVYRIKDPFVLFETEDFTLNVAGVELIVTDQNHFRCIGNKDLTVRGPVILDAEPLAWSQMQIIGFDAKEFTIDGRVFEGYPMPEKGGRIEIFTPEGVMLPHTQDGPSECKDMGDGVLRIKMCSYTWEQYQTHVEDIIKCGNYVAMELMAQGGLEMRSNTNTTWEDVSMHTHGLAWGQPLLGENKFIRWKGTRRRGTNRLVGGGFPLMCFRGGDYILLDSEIGHNFDDLTDVATYATFAFGQLSPNQFYIMENDFHPGWALGMYNITTMERYCECRVVTLDKVDDPAIKKRFKELAEKHNVLDRAEPLLCTVDCDIEMPEFSWVSMIPAICRSMRFERNYIHDGLAAGITSKGANEVIIRDNIVERANMLGILVCFDPYWWEGNASRNIEISNNTVRNVAYQPECDGAGITVCVGGQPSQTGTGQPHQGVVIRNNAVYSSGGCGIAVTNAADVLIADNVITDTNVYGYDRGALYVNAVSEGTRIVGNVFAGTDASEEARQITTGHLTDPSKIIVRNNRTANPEVGVPDVAWHAHLVPNDDLVLTGESWWVREPYPWTRADASHKGDTATFHFDGTRVEVIAPCAPYMGMGRVFIDDQFVSTVDQSRRYGQQMLPFFISPHLPPGRHTIRLVNDAVPGKFTNEDECHFAVACFNVLPSVSPQC